MSHRLKSPSHEFGENIRDQQTTVAVGNFARDFRSRTRKVIMLKYTVDIASFNGPIFLPDHG